jgi:hypothetical protein
VGGYADLGGNNCHGLTKLGKRNQIERKGGRGDERLGKIVCGTMRGGEV